VSWLADEVAFSPVHDVSTVIRIVALFAGLLGMILDVVNQTSARITKHWT
jgi:hypothetical protein